jgi:hypothetical protein
MHIAGNLRRRVFWESRHDNGWTTVIAEQKDGCIAFASNEQAVCIDYVGHTVTHAHAAVIAALRWKTGHRRCTNECSDWRMLGLQSEKAADSEESGCRSFRLGKRMIL